MEHIGKGIATLGLVAGIVYAPNVVVMDIFLALATGLWAGAADKYPDHPAIHRRGAAGFDLPFYEALHPPAAGRAGPGVLMGYTNGFQRPDQSTAASAVAAVPWQPVVDNGL